MKTKTEANQSCTEQIICKNHHHSCGNSSAIYGLGAIGAMFYFLQHASGLTAILIGIGKAVFWPALLMFKLLGYLQM